MYVQSFPVSDTDRFQALIDSLNADLIRNVVAERPSEHRRWTLPTRTVQRRDFEHSGMPDWIKVLHIAYEDGRNVSTWIHTEVDVPSRVYVVSTRPF